MIRTISIAAVLALGCARGLSAQPASSVHSFAWGSGQSSGQDAKYFPANVLGYPDASARRTVPTVMPEHIASLGLGGEIVLRFDQPITDGAGPDFTVFENAFYYSIGQRERLFAEPAVVSVSRDGITYATFACDPHTLEGCAGTAPTHGDRDPLDPRVSGGNSFDLSDIGADSIRFVRIRDVTSTVLNDPEHPYWDATLSGFDLDAVIAIPFAGRGPKSSAQSPDSDDIHIAPNPAQSRVRVRAPHALRVRVVDGLGRVVIDRASDGTSGEIALDVSAIATGVYMVESFDPHRARHTAILRIVR